MTDQTISEVLEADRVPQAIWEGDIRVFGVSLRAYVLNDGRRIVDADDVAKLFESDLKVDESKIAAEIALFAAFCRGSGVPDAASRLATTEEAE